MHIWKDKISLHEHYVHEELILFRGRELRLIEE